jgi:hypothetical protein
MILTMTTFKKSGHGFIFMLLLFSFLQGQAQVQERGIINKTPVFAISSNLLYDATTSMNLGLEVKTGKQFTFKLPVTYNPWELKDNQKFKFILTQPELRWWLCDPFSGHYFGLHGHYAFYNVGAVGTDHMKKYRYEGDLYGAGISYGYQFYLAPRWSLEASIGAGYAHMTYDVYECETCGKFIKNEEKNYFGPTQAGISLIYIIK